MGKFVKKFSDFVKERKESAFSIAGASTFLSTEKRYKLFKKGIDGFLSGKPSKQDELAFSILWAFPGYGIDKKYNRASRKRCKVMSKDWKKKKVVSEEDKKFLKEELIPYVSDSYKRETDNLFSLLSKISGDEAKQGYDLFKKNEKAIRGVVK